MSSMNANLNSHLFADSFHQFRGMTVEQAAQGYGYPFGRGGGNELQPPEEVDEINKHYAKKFNRPFIPAREAAEETMSQHRPVEDLVGSWARNHKEIMVGTNDAAIARDVMDLGSEIRTNSRMNEVKLYRGADISPAEQAAKAPDRPLSFTEDHHVARSFAKSGGSRGSIFHAHAGSVRGIYVPDYVPRQRTVGQSQRPEREWLIDPGSVQGG